MRALAGAKSSSHRQYRLFSFFIHTYTVLTFFLVGSALFEPAFHDRPRATKAVLILEFVSAGNLCWSWNFGFALGLHVRSNFISALDGGVGYVRCESMRRFGAARRRGSLGARAHISSRVKEGRAKRNLEPGWAHVRSSSTLDPEPSAEKQSHGRDIKVGYVCCMLFCALCCTKQ